MHATLPMTRDAGTNTPVSSEFKGPRLENSAGSSEVFVQASSQSLQELPMQGSDANSLSIAFLGDENGKLMRLAKSFGARVTLYRLPNMKMLFLNENTF